MSSSHVSATQTRRPSASQAQRTAEAKAAFTDSLNSVGSSLDSDLQGRAKNIYENAKVLKKQEVELQKETKKLAKQGDEMQRVVDQAQRDIKGFDNLDALMADLDRDLAVIEDTLKLVEEGDDEEPDQAGTATKLSVPKANDPTRTN